MGCSNSKSTKSLPVIKHHQVAEKKNVINPHNEDEVAEVIEIGKKSNKEEEVLNNLSQMKKNESKTTLAEFNNVSKQVPPEPFNNSSFIDKPYDGNSIINLTKIPTEKLSFEKVEHKFEFDLDLEEIKANDLDHNKIIDDLAEELNDY